MGEIVKTQYLSRIEADRDTILSTHWKLGVLTENMQIRLNGLRSGAMWPILEFWDASYITGTAKARDKLCVLREGSGGGVTQLTSKFTSFSPSPTIDTPPQNKEDKLQQLATPSRRNFKLFNKGFRIFNWTTVRFCTVPNKQLLKSSLQRWV